MNQDVIKKLKSWRSKQGRKENVKLYMILHNKTIEDLATILPKTKEELLTIKGIGEKNYQKYGKEILSIMIESDKDDFIEVPEDAEEPAYVLEREERIYSVSNYLDKINSKLSESNAKIRGEVSNVSLKSHLYFSLKDKDDGCVLSCFMWANDYEMCGIEIKEGMELTIHGFARIYKPTGRFNFRTDAVELVGEGALKKAYEELKRKLKAEGLFEEARKKPMPEYPQRIGLITSRNGAVINDFMSNIGRFGYHITFMDSRVEGIMAVKDLIDAVKYFKDKPLDVLVIIRGGGSLENLQAFNNEALIREVACLNVPVICGIGHDKDVPLLSYVADMDFSTPSIVVKEINKSWEQALERFDHCESIIISRYEGILRESRYNLENASTRMKDFYQGIFRKFEQYQQRFKDFIANISHAIRHEKYKIAKLSELLVSKLRDDINGVREMLDAFNKGLYHNSPERQLKLGYSIITLNKKIIKSVSQVKKGDMLINKLGDGEIQSEVQ